MTHNRNYLRKFYGIGNLTKDLIFNKSQDIFGKKVEENNGIIETKLNQIITAEEYSKLKNRPRDWTERGEKKLRETVKSDLTYYKVPSGKEKQLQALATFHELQAQMLSYLKEIRKARGMKSQKMKDLFNISINQCEVMLDIIKRNHNLVNDPRLEETLDCHNDLKLQYKALEKETNQTNSQ